MPGPKRNPAIPWTTGDRILRVLGRYQYMTRPQIHAATGLSAKSHSLLPKTLKELTDHDYTALVWAPTRQKAGSNKGVWTLKGKGRAYLADRGLPFPHRIAMAPERQILFLEHALAVNDVLIACERFAPDAVITPEHVLKRAPFKATLDDGRTVSAVPDGIAEFQVGGYVYITWIELDRGTEPRDRWKLKVQAIVRYLESVPEKRIDVLVVTTAGEKRRNHLWRWTAEQLASLQRHQWADLFRITHLLPSQVTPEQFFTYPHWLRPFDETFYALIEGGQP